MAIKMAKKQKLAMGVTFTFADGRELACSLPDLSETMITQLAVHGIAQKVGDSYASAESVSEAFENAKATWENLLRGDFNARAQGSGGLVVEALARIKGVEIDVILDGLAQMSEEERETLKKNPRVKAMMDVIRGEKAAAKLVEGEDELDFDLPKPKKGKKE